MYFGVEHFVYSRKNERSTLGCLNRILSQKVLTSLIYLFCSNAEIVALSPNFPNKHTRFYLHVMQTTQPKSILNLIDLMSRSPPEN